MPHGANPSLPPSDLPLSALPPMPLPAQQHKHIFSTVTVENNVAYPFRLRHSYGQQANDYQRPFKPTACPPDRPDSAIVTGMPFGPITPPSHPNPDDEDDEIARPHPAHLPYSSGFPSARFSHASGSGSLRSTPSPTSADFPVIPTRPPLRPTVSFGGVSRMSYYSNLSAERELETRSLSLARAEEEEVRVRMAPSLSDLSIKAVKGFVCWPEARRKARS